MITLRYGWGADGRIEDHMVQRGYADVAAARAAVSEVPADLAARGRVLIYARAEREDGAWWPLVDGVPMEAPRRLIR